MDMVQVKNGQVIQTELPSSGYLSEGRCVTGYNLLPLQILLSEGWLPLEKVIPSYDSTTKCLVHNAYEIQSDKVIETFTVEDIPSIVENNNAELLKEQLAQQVQTTSDLMDLLFTNVPELSNL